MYANTSESFNNRIFLAMPLLTSLCMLITSIPANGETYHISNNLVDVMDWDYGIGIISDIDISPYNGAEFTIDGPLSGTGWWDIGLAWADPDLYPPGLDLSAYDAAAIKVTNLADTGVAAKMYINYGWDHTGGNVTIESVPWIVIGAGQVKLFIMDFSSYGIDRPHEIVKLGVHLGMNCPDDDPNGYYPAGSQMRVLVSALEGDFNGDDFVNMVDYAVFAEHWLEQDCNDPDYCRSADLDKKGQVDSEDLRIFCENFLI